MKMSRKVMLVSAISALAIAGSTAAAWALSQNANAKLLSRLQTEFPATKITGVNCDFKIKGVCEVVAGKNVFYATADGQKVFIGEVLDLKSKTNLTAARITELAAMAGAEAKIGGAPSAPQANAELSAPAAPSSVIKVDLPKDNAVVHNAGAPLKLTVFADYNCHFCQQLFNDLKAHPEVEITEYPIAILGPESETKAKRVLCANDKTAAANALYYGGEMRTAGECDAGAAKLAQNQAFARQHGISGTPMLIRGDGATNSGWMPGDKLLAWLKSAKV